MKSGIVAALFFLVGCAAAQDCSIADVLFIMDESSSIWPDPFTQQKQFIKNLIDMFQVGEDLARVGLVRFASKARLEFPMKAYFDKSSLYGAVDRIQQEGGNTNTGDALRVAREQALTVASGARPGNPRIPQIAIVITDGNSQETEITKQQASLTRDTGVIIFAIGVGKDISRQELENIASGPEYIFAVENYDALDSILERLGKQACNIVPTLPPENIVNACRQKKMDIALVLDKSSSVSEEDFAKMRSLAQSMLFSFQLSPEFTHAAVLSYSDASKIHNYLQYGSDRAQLYDEIGGIAQSPGQSNTEGAFKSLRSVFNPRYGARSKVAKVALFITNARSSDIGAAAAEAKTLFQDFGVEVFAVAIGNDVDAGAWRNVAGRDHVIEEAGYDSLTSAARNDVAESICPVQPPSKDFPCGERNPADIAFVLDTQNAGANDLSSLNSFIRDVTNKFEIGPNKIQVSVVENECHQLDGFALNTYGTKPDVLNALNFNIKSNTANALEKLMRETFTPGNGARAVTSGTQRYAVLFVDGTPGSQQEAERAAALAKNEGDIQIFVIGIGEKVDRAALEGIASSPKHVMMVNGYSDLEGNKALSEGISNAICKRESEDKPEPEALIECAPKPKA